MVHLVKMGKYLSLLRMEDLPNHPAAWIACPPLLSLSSPLTAFLFLTPSLPLLLVLLVILHCQLFQNFMPHQPFVPPLPAVVPSWLTAQCSCSETILTCSSVGPQPAHPWKYIKLDKPCNKNWYQDRPRKQLAVVSALPSPANSVGELLRKKNWDLSLVHHLVSMMLAEKSRLTILPSVGWAVSSNKSYTYLFT